jgi:hypothetical protein
VFTGEVVVVPEDGEVSPEQLDEATDRLAQLDWKIHDLSVVPVEKIHIPDPEEAKD